MLGAWKTWLQITCLMLCSKDRNENYNSRNLAESQGTQVPSCNPAVLGLNSGLKVNCAGGTTEGLLKFSTDVRINMRKNGEISVLKRSASLKRSWRRRKQAPSSPGSNAEPRLKVLRCWCRLSWMNTTKRDGHLCWQIIWAGLNLVSCMENTESPEIYTERAHITSEYCWQALMPTSHCWKSRGNVNEARNTTNTLLLFGRWVD